MNEMMQSPCLTCRRVKDPVNCDNKDCMQWRRWFIRCWDQLRSIYGKTGEKDPCEGCWCPKELCFEPCQQRKNWEAGR